MKKIALSLLVLTLALFLAAPAMADFNPYGSLRMETWYVTDQVAVGDDDSDLLWDMQHNSRIGAKASTGDIKARYELGLRTTGQSGGDVYTRLMFASVKMGGGTLLLGQTYTPYIYSSSSVADTDLAFDGYGDTYDGRQPQFKFTMDSGLYFAAIRPSTAQGVITTTDPTDIDTTLPKLAVGIETKLDGVSLGGGIAYNTFNIEIPSVNFDESINSMLFYVHAKADLGAVALQGNFGYGTNLNNFGIGEIPSGSATVDSSGNVEDTTSMTGYLQATFKAGDTPINIGVGYTSSDNDAYSDPDTQMSYFVNATISLADNFFIVPEISMFDKMDDTSGNEEDDQMWVGVKWQMNF